MIGWKTAVRTKPIPGGAGWDTAAGTWDTGKMCETNPICRSRQQAGGPIVQNEPNLGKSGLDPGADCAKQTQFAADGQGRPSSRPKALAMPPLRGQLRQTNPIWRRGLSYGTNPIPGSWRPAQYPPFHYAIIPPFQPYADCAKRTQFLSGGWRPWGLSLGPRPCGLRPSLARLCKTNPLPGRAGWDGARGTRGGVIGRNKANWPPHRPDQRRRGR